MLLAKFPIFRDEELESVNHVAGLYSELLKDISGLTIPVVKEGMYSSWAQYTIQLPAQPSADAQLEYRKKVQGGLKEAGIPSNIYYIKPMHKQGAFANTRSAIADCPATERLCDSVLCLPIHPYLEDREIEFIARKFKETL